MDIRMDTLGGGKIYQYSLYNFMNHQSISIARISFE